MLTRDEDSTKTIPRMSLLLQRTRTDVKGVRYDSVVTPSELKFILYDGPNRLWNGFRNKEGEARAAKRQRTKVYHYRIEHCCLRVHYLPNRQFSVVGRDF